MDIARRSVFVDGDDERSTARSISGESSDIDSADSVDAFPSVVGFDFIEGGSFGDDFSDDDIGGSISTWVEEVNVVVQFTDEMSAFVDLDIGDTGRGDGDGERRASLGQAIGWQR